jgi:hypothetical protein
MHCAQSRKPTLCFCCLSVDSLELSPRASRFFVLAFFNTYNRSSGQLVCATVAVALLSLKSVLFAARVDWLSAASVERPSAQEQLQLYQRNKNI